MNNKFFLHFLLLTFNVFFCFLEEVKNKNTLSSFIQSSISSIISFPEVLIPVGILLVLCGLVIKNKKKNQYSILKFFKELKKNNQFSDEVKESNFKKEEEKITNLKSIEQLLSDERIDIKQKIGIHTQLLKLLIINQRIKAQCQMNKENQIKAAIVNEVSIIYHIVEGDPHTLMHAYVLEYANKNVCEKLDYGQMSDEVIIKQYDEAYSEYDRLHKHNKRYGYQFKRHFQCWICGLETNDERAQRAAEDIMKKIRIEQKNEEKITVSGFIIKQFEGQAQAMYLNNLPLFDFGPASEPLRKEFCAIMENDFIWYQEFFRNIIGFSRDEAIKIDDIFKKILTIVELIKKITIQAVLQEEPQDVDQSKLKISLISNLLRYNKYLKSGVVLKSMKPADQKQYQEAQNDIIKYFGLANALRQREIILNQVEEFFKKDHQSVRISLYDSIKKINEKHVDEKDVKKIRNEINQAFPEEMRKKKKNK
jgi:hypothetical protein